jgi:hypothetical protein
MTTAELTKWLETAKPAPPTIRAASAAHTLGGRTGASVGGLLAVIVVAGLVWQFAASKSKLML